MSETPAPPAAPNPMGEHTHPGEFPAEPVSSYPIRLAYAVYGALNADLGCLIGAIAFVILIYLSVAFAPQLTPCTSAGGIPCAP
jgi:hypothetical protein